MGFFLSFFMYVYVCVGVGWYVMRTFAYFMANNVGLEDKAQETSFCSNRPHVAFFFFCKQTKAKGFVIPLGSSG